MFTSEMRIKWYNLFAQEIQGGCSNDMMTMIDEWIDHGLVKASEFAEHESEICYLFDTYWFTCERCDWTRLTCEMEYDEDGWYCTDCKDE